jgi:hypothetical protein
MEANKVTDILKQLPQVELTPGRLRYDEAVPGLVRQEIAA